MADDDAKVAIDNLRVKWNKFFFEPISPVPIALFRIVLGLITLQCLCIHLLADWKLYFGDHPLIPLEDFIYSYWHTNPYFDLLLLLPPGEEWRWYFFWFVVAAAFCLTIGLFTRVTAVITFLGIMSLQHHFLANQNSGDNYLRIALFFVALSNAGDALSVDSLIRSLRQDWRQTGLLAPLSSPWAQRLLQIQLSIAYFHTWWCKISGPAWNDGTAVYYASRYDDIMRFPIPFLLDNMWTIKALTYGTLVIEFALGTLIWVRPIRYWVLLFGLALHLGIEWTMNLPMFEWLFMATYFLFIYPEDLARAWDYVTAFVHKHICKPVYVLFDGHCIVCIRIIGLLYRLDVFRLLNFVDFRAGNFPEFVADADLARLESEMMVKTNNGKWLGGYQAFRYISHRILWLAWLAPFLYVPGISHMGDFVYRWVAANRFKILGRDCPDGVCSLEPKGNEA
ncbi:MAG: DUF393 domain-containing protein [Cyanobacteria bacterium TGS_CYA1]|nr:DUF393 domain-containing protein [Cyanobacteria bacterium TGS_CYA1]